MSWSEMPRGCRRLLQNGRCGWVMAEMFLVCAHRHCVRRILNVYPYSTSAIFGDPKSAEFVAAAASVDSLPRLHGLPEVIVTGRANAGKSTLLNAVLGRKALVHTSKRLAGLVS